MSLWRYLRFGEAMPLLYNWPPLLLCAVLSGGINTQEMDKKSTLFCAEGRREGITNTRSCYFPRHPLDKSVEKQRSFRHEPVKFGACCGAAKEGSNAGLDEGKIGASSSGVVETWKSRLAKKASTMPAIWTELWNFPTLKQTFRHHPSDKKTAQLYTFVSCDV